MLKFLRQKPIVVKILWGLIILMLPAFVFWGMGNMKHPEEAVEGTAGAMDGVELSLQDLFKSMTAVRAQMVLNYFGDAKVLDAFFNNKPLQAMLGWKRLLLLKESEGYGVTVSDREVISYIQSHPLFFKKGRFNTALYNDRLKYSMGLIPRDFEEIVRGNLAVQKLKEMISKDITVSDEELLREYKKDTGKIKISYILMTTKDLAGQARIDDKTVRDYYEAHKLEFMSPADKESGGSGISDFENVREGIRSYLSEKQAIARSYKHAEDIYKNISEAIEKENATFEAASEKLGFKVTESALFSSEDKVEGIGDGYSIMDIALRLTKPGQISNPIETKDGIIIFTLTGSEGFDEEKFKKEKADYREKVLESKKLNRLDERFKELLPRARLDIDFKDIEKYHK